MGQAAQNIISMMIIHRKIYLVFIEVGFVILAIYLDLLWHRIVDFAINVLLISIITVI